MAHKAKLIYRIIYTIYYKKKYICFKIKISNLYYLMLRYELKNYWKKNINVYRKYIENSLNNFLLIIIIYKKQS